MTETHKRLNIWAFAFLAGLKIEPAYRVTHNADGSIDLIEAGVKVRHVGPRAKKYPSTRSYLDKYMNKHFLNDYHFPNGTVFHEMLQLDADHGSPYCTALQDKNGHWIAESLWNPEEQGSNLKLPPAQFIRRIA